MSSKNSSASDTADRDIFLTRTLGAPRELVWSAITDPKHVVHGWGPRGFTTTIEEMDVRPGGAWKHTMRGPDGTNYPNHSVFREVVKPERIVYMHGGHREGGPGMSFVATWSFAALSAAQTKVTLRMVFPSAENRDFVIREFGAFAGGKPTPPVSPSIPRCHRAHHCPSSSHANSPRRAPSSGVRGPRWRS
ncbi:MAG: SRPBCC domain-containing protein [Undibacterium sp.]|nr:SRPBCC domain-containing protein [Opitutaceae bacterium]